ncbi:MAG: hypothetical protein ACRC1P_05265 [Cellulosilyticaceae bacterium]
MVSQNLLEIKKAKYNEKITIIILQTILCVVILLTVCGLKIINSEWILSMRGYLQQDMEWQIIYEILLKLKESILHYIR